MTATGRVSEDLPAIKTILDQRGGPMYYKDDTWWGTPSSEESIDALAKEYGELPQDVIDFYRVTDTAAFGRLDQISSPQQMIARIGKPSPYSIEEQEDAPFIFQENVPQGHEILPMSTESDWGCLVELGGPDHGRVINPPHGGSYWRTLAWSLGDAIACTLELYEFGWFQWESGFAGQQMTRAGKPTDEGLAELARVQKIIDKWNCNPVIALFHDPYGYEPPKPTNR